MKQPKILVVDDDSALLELMAGRLRRLGFEPDLGHDGRAAMVMINRSNFDLIVTDIYMPEVDGLQILAAAREKDPNVQVIVVTAAATVDNAITALNAGASNYLTKPFDHLKVFDKAVSQALEFRRLTLDNIRLGEIQRRRGDMLEDEVADRIQQLRKSQRELPELLARMPDGVLVLDHLGQIVLSNPVAEKWLAIEWRTPDHPLQAYLADLHMGLEKAGRLIRMKGRTLYLHATEIEMEGGKERQMVLLQDVGGLLEAAGVEFIQPVTNMKRALNWLFRQRLDTTSLEVVKYIAQQVARLEAIGVDPAPSPGKPVSARSTTGAGESSLVEQATLVEIATD